MLLSLYNLVCIYFWKLSPRPLLSWFCLIKNHLHKKIISILIFYHSKQFWKNTSLSRVQVNAVHIRHIISMWLARSYLLFLLHNSHLFLNKYVILKLYNVTYLCIYTYITHKALAEMKFVWSRHLKFIVHKWPVNCEIKWSNLCFYFRKRNAAKLSRNLKRLWSWKEARSYRQLWVKNEAGQRDSQCEFLAVVWSGFVYCNCLM